MSSAGNNATRDVRARVKVEVKADNFERSGLFLNLLPSFLLPSVALGCNLCAGVRAPRE